VRFTRLALPVGKGYFFVGRASAPLPGAPQARRATLLATPSPADDVGGVRVEARQRRAAKAKA
jgi:hypothetical protein